MLLSVERGFATTKLGAGRLGNIAQAGCAKGGKGIKKRAECPFCHEIL
jgi:hypothetical protein